MEKAEAAWNRAVAEGPLDPVRIDLLADEKLRDALEQSLMDAVPGLRVTIQLLPLGMEARATRLPSDTLEESHP